MKKNNIILTISIILNVILIFIFTSQQLFKGGGETDISEAYEQFYSTGENTVSFLNQINSQSPDEEVTNFIFVDYTHLQFLNEKVNLLDESKSFFSKLKTSDLSTQFNKMSHIYRSIMYSQIMKRKALESDEFQDYKKALNTLFEEVPKEYSKSNTFTNDFNKAVDEFKRLTSMY